MPSIRPRTPSDLTGLITLLDRLHGEPYPGHLAGTTRHEKLTWLEMYAPLRSWVAEHNGIVVGHVQVTPADARLCEVVGTAAGALLEVGRLFVSPAVRRLGVGAGLLQTAASWADLQGGQPVLRVSDYLDDAIRLYRKEGWTAVGRLLSELSEDQLLVFTRT